MLNKTILPQLIFEEVLDCRIHSTNEIMLSVAVAEIDPKNASEILQQFAALLPLQQYNLDHMKRVRRNKLNCNILEILVCPEKYLEDIPQHLKEIYKSNTLRITHVPKLKPLTRIEYEEWGKEWPTMFRPNAMDKEREKGISVTEMAQHTYYMSLVDKDALNVMNETSPVSIVNNLVGNNSNSSNSSTSNTDVCNSTSLLDEHSNNSTHGDHYSRFISGGGIMINPQNGMVSK